MISEYKLIFTSKLARQLLKEGYQIVDIKPSKENKDRTIFAFKNSEQLEKLLNNLPSNKK